jgi:hypothetical protein
MFLKKSCHERDRNLSLKPHCTILTRKETQKHRRRIFKKVSNWNAKQKKRWGFFFRNWVGFGIKNGKTQSKTNE